MKDFKQDMNNFLLANEEAMFWFILDHFFMNHTDEKEWHGFQTAFGSHDITYLKNLVTNYKMSIASQQIGESQAATWPKTMCINDKPYAKIHREIDQEKYTISFWVEFLLGVNEQKEKK